MHVLAFHGLPTSPRLWERLNLPEGWSLDAPGVPGLGPEGTPSDWNLRDCAEALRPQVTGEELLVGHDLGGVLAAMLAQPGQSLVLSGTALGMYWAGIRLLSRPPFQRYFFQRHEGRHFLSRGSLPEHSPSLLEAFGDHGDNWGDRMRIIARGMRPPLALALRLRSCAVRLAWGRKDPWYPHWIARSLERTTGGNIYWLESGHFAPWEDPQGFTDILTGEALID
jgi:pimeloyl-ACP methyl ester carboxylesterase